MSLVNKRLQQAVHEQMVALGPQDITPYENFDVRPHVSLLSKAPVKILKQINEYVAPLREAFPEQYYYAPNQYHATLLALKVDERLEKIKPVLVGNKLTVTPRGLSMNRYGMAVPLYPSNPILLRKLRQDLDSVFGSVHDYSEHASVWEEMLWINFMRFTTQPTQEFFDYLQSYEQRRLDSFNITEWTATVIRSRVLDPAVTMQLETYKC